MIGKIFVMVLACLFVGGCEDNIGINKTVSIPIPPIIEQGKLIKLTIVSTSFNERQRTSVETTTGFFVILGYASGKKEGRCYLEGNALYIEQSNGKYLGYYIG